MVIYALVAEKYKDPRRYYYGVQKGQAKARGIPFELTFDEWWALWEPFWDIRGKGQDNACMCRLGDSGPYAVGNVYIGTCRHNREEAKKRIPRGNSHPRAVHLDVEAIKADYSTGNFSWNSLAEKYNTSKRTIGRVLKGEFHPMERT